MKWKLLPSRSISQGFWHRLEETVNAPAYLNMIHPQFLNQRPKPTWDYYKVKCLGPPVFSVQRVLGLFLDHWLKSGRETSRQKLSSAHLPNKGSGFLSSYDQGTLAPNHSTLNVTSPWGLAQTVLQPNRWHIFRPGMANWPRRTSLVE